MLLPELVVVEGVVVLLGKLFEVVVFEVVVSGLLGSVVLPGLSKETGGAFGASALELSPSFFTHPIKAGMAAKTNKTLAILLRIFPPIHAPKCAIVAHCAWHRAMQCSCRVAAALARAVGVA
jgi:hypothetical protein